MYIDEKGNLKIRANEIPCLEDVEFGDPKLMALTLEEKESALIAIAATLARKVAETKEREASLDRREIRINAQQELITTMLGSILSTSLTPPTQN